MKLAKLDYFWLYREKNLEKFALINLLDFLKSIQQSLCFKNERNESTKSNQDYNSNDEVAV